MYVGEGVRGLETRGVLFAAENGKLTKSLVGTLGGVSKWTTIQFVCKIERGFDFSTGIVYPNSHTDFKNSDKISARPHLECENRDQMCSLITF